MVYNSIDFWHAQYSWVSSRFITYGCNEESIEIHDPMPGRRSFTVTSEAFRYFFGRKPRELEEYCLIQW